MARLASQRLAEGAILLLELGPAPSNIIDRAMMGELSGALASAASAPALKLVVLKGAGEQFSYGASVPEHTPDQVGAMLPEFHALLRAMNDLNLPPLMALVQGRCLGGGFEVALGCDLIAATGNAQLGCPEIHLGVFPPAGSALLPLRISAGRAAAMLLAGGTVGAEEAAGLGLVDIPLGETADPMAAVEEWASQNLLRHSAAALRQARKAARWPWTRALQEELPRLERQYLEELMDTEDAAEGIQAFLEKRKPDWKNA
ncbi:MAG: enoyl-CoA hydratase/isomerase family protein [Planctomycetota bacterium]|jgi:cyclohexa-1,5-dienecarbonyl-CoA hydratase